MVRLNLSLNNVKTCKETTFVKETYLPQGLLFEKVKEPKKIRAGNTCKILENYAKLKLVMNFK